MRNILCFGDSNTWGYNPERGCRFPRNVRWAGALQDLLGSSYNVIEEGLNGRTTIHDDPAEGGMGDKNGLKILPTLLSTHCPLDLVIIMLGTNDFKKRFSVDAFEIAMGLGRLVRTVKTHDYFPATNVPAVMLLSPPEISYLHEDFKGHFNSDVPEKSKKLASAIEQLANDNSCSYIDVAAFADTSKTDGIHLCKSDQMLLAKKVCENVNKILG